MPMFDVVIEHTETRFLCVTVDADTDSQAADHVEQIIAECHRNPDDITERLQACWDTESGAVDVATVELAPGSCAAPPSLSLPRRLQWKRGMPKLPPNTKYVGRPSRFGNPYKVGKDGDAEACVRQFTLLYEHSTGFRAMVRHELRGFDLACGCEEGAHWCHGNVLLTWANEP